MLDDIEKTSFLTFLNYFKNNTLSHFNLKHNINIINDKFLFKIQGNHNSKIFIIFGLYDYSNYAYIPQQKINTLENEIKQLKRYYDEDVLRIFIYSYSNINMYNESNIFICNHLTFKNIFTDNFLRLTIKNDKKNNDKLYHSYLKKTKTIIEEESNFIPINNNNKNERLRKRNKNIYIESDDDTDDDKIYKKVKNSYKGIRNKYDTDSFDEFLDDDENDDSNYESDEKTLDDSFEVGSDETTLLLNDISDFQLQEKWIKTNKHIKTNDFVRPNLNNIKSENEEIFYDKRKYSYEKNNEKDYCIISDNENNIENLIKSDNERKYILYNVKKISFNNIVYENIKKLVIEVNNNIDIFNE
jgi:hypothetical protein